MEIQSNVKHTQRKRKRKRKTIIGRAVVFFLHRSTGGNAKTFHR